MHLDFSQQLPNTEIKSSAPCRVDVGGTWDLKCFALPYTRINPATTNIAVSLRTTIRLTPYREGWVRISDGKHHEEFPFSDLDLSGHFGLLFAIVSHFGVAGVDIQISYGCPPRSGVGGSGTLSVALSGALAKTQELIGGEGISREAVVELAYTIEDGLRFSYTGLQDQCAAAFGGVHQWHWTYGSLKGNFRRRQVMDPERYADLNSRLVLAYVGKSHDSNDVNSQQVADFLAGHHRIQWLRVNEIASEFAEALASEDWGTAGELLDEETRIRCAIVPSRITQLGEKLQDASRQVGAGFATAGSGNGGCVWSLTRSPADAPALAERWEDVMQEVPAAHMISAVVDADGLSVVDTPAG